MGNYFGGKNSVDILYNKVKIIKCTDEKIEVIKKNISEVTNHERFQYDLNYRINNIIILEPFSIMIPATLTLMATAILTLLKEKLNNIGLELMPTIESVIAESTFGIYYNMFKLLLTLLSIFTFLLIIMYISNSRKKSTLLNIKEIFDKEMAIKKEYNKPAIAQTSADLNNEVENETQDYKEYLIKVRKI